MLSESCVRAQFPRARATLCAAVNGNLGAAPAWRAHKTGRHRSAKEAREKGARRAWKAGGKLNAQSPSKTHLYQLRDTRYQV